MSTSFLKSNKKIYVENMAEGTRVKQIPAKIYSIEFSREEGFYLLNIQDKYALPDKLYGDYLEGVKRVIHTHYSKKGNTGILLTGIKGAGKSVFIKTVCNAMLDLDVPVIQINKAYQGEDLFNFVESLGNCVLLFDEFGKIYSSHSRPDLPTQNSLLSLFDGLSNSKRLHLFTENNPEFISPYLINRPGRIHYHFKYNRLSLKVIEELCRDSGLPEETITEMLNLSNRLKVLSFDVVKCLIDEWKLYGGSIQDHIDILNVSLLNNPDEKEVEVISFKTGDDKDIPKQSIIAKLSHGRIYVDIKNEADQRFYDSNEDVLLEDAYLIDGDTYHFKTKTGSIAILRIKDAGAF